MDETGSLFIDGVLKVILHPGVAGMKPRVKNIALLYLKEPVQFNKFISPVCLQNFNEEIVGQTVYAVGFGVDSYGNLARYKRQVPLVVLSDEICRRFFNTTMEKGKAGKFFCARGNGVETPCRYDKALYIKKDGRWFLTAMSSSFKVFKNKLCRPKAPVLYEDLTPMINWVESEISENKID